MTDAGAIVSVLDFRRRRMAVRWNTAIGSWAADEESPPVVNGIALIRSVQPHICIFGQGGKLKLQIGRDQYVLAEHSPRILCRREIFALGLRRRFTVESTTTGMLFSHSHWSNSGTDFFKILADKAADPDWRAMAARQWSEGIESAQLRQSWV